VSDSLSKVRVGYDRWSAVYDYDANPLQALEDLVMRRAIGDPSGLHVVDLGCGTGRHSLWLAEHGANVIALDFSAGMLEEARRKSGADAVQFIQHDLLLPLPLSDGELDTVVSGLVLEHLRELDGFFLEACRILRQGGRAIISAMHPAMFLRGSQARFTDPATGELVQPGSVAHSISDFVMAAVRANFTISNVEEFAPDSTFAARYPRAEKYIGWPMLVVMQLKK
jgi:malonyl-CoA O-methyltransferase